MSALYNIEIKEILRIRLDSLRSLRSKGLESKSFPKEEFLKFIEETRLEALTIIVKIENSPLKDQIKSIAEFQAVIEMDPFLGYFVRFLPDKHSNEHFNWNKKGKYAYDLNQLELKLQGAIFKIENNSIPF